MGDERKNVFFSVQSALLQEDQSDLRNGSSEWILLSFYGLENVLILCISHPVKSLFHPKNYPPAFDLFESRKLKDDLIWEFSTLFEALIKSRSIFTFWHQNCFYLQLHQELHQQPCAHMMQHKHGADRMVEFRLETEVSVHVFQQRRVTLKSSLFRLKSDRMSSGASGQRTLQLLQ